MEFLLVFGARFDAVEAVAELSALRLCSELVSGSLDSHRVGSSTLLHTGELISAGKRLVLFDGYLREDGRLQDRESLGAMTAVKLASQAGIQVYAVSTVRFLGSRIRVHLRLARDALAQYPIFVWQRGGRLCASNNLFFLEWALAKIGEPGSRSVESALYESVLGVGSGNRTRLESVELVAPGNAWVSESLMTFAETLGERAKHEKVVVDRTGGKDSRMVLAALVGAGVHREAEFFTNGPATCADVLAAAPLYERYSLRAARFYKENCDKPIDVIEHSRRAVFRHQGCATLLRENPGRLRLLGQSRVHWSCSRPTTHFRPGLKKRCARISSLAVAYWVPLSQKMVFGAGSLQPKVPVGHSVASRQAQLRSA